MPISRASQRGAGGVSLLFFESAPQKLVSGRAVLGWRLGSRLPLEKLVERFFVFLGRELHVVRRASEARVEEEGGDPGRGKKGFE
jgi:hypothetical protein